VVWNSVSYIHQDDPERIIEAVDWIIEQGE